MMDIRQIQDALARVYSEDGARVVFWNDPDREFQNEAPFVHLDGVTLIRLDEASALEVKVQIETNDPLGQYLLYSPSEEPEYETDWLLDIRLYSRPFRADRASILLDELGLESQHLRSHIADRRKFFDNKDRVQKLKALVDKHDTAADLDLKMIAVVVKAEQPEFFTIARTLYHAFADTADAVDLDIAPPAWEQLEKFELAQTFWEMVRVHFGYGDENPTLKKLLIRLLVTDFIHHLNADTPAALLNLVLTPQGRPNAIVCLAQWRDSASRSASYDRLSEEVAALINLEDQIQALGIHDLLNVMTFVAVERAIARRLRDRVQAITETIDPEDVRIVANRRQAGHWALATAHGDAGVPRKALNAVYTALVAAAEFFALKNSHRAGFAYSDALAMYHAYEDDLFRFDQLYRHFCESADHAESEGWNILKPLRDLVERGYTNWFVPQVALAWGQFLDPAGETGLLNYWRLETVPNEHAFFEHFVQRQLDEGENRKVFVIISDAFRYEAAKELVRELNGKYRLEAALESQLGVLPSYTSLGMASLLPHASLAYKSNGDVLLDGKPTASFDQRNELLVAVQGVACKAPELLAKKKEEGREFVSGRRVVYIYHNTVDAMGDSASTEDKTFDAVRTAINELADLVGYIVNYLNGNFVLITADHGFMFADTAPGEPEKSKLTEKPEGTVRAKKRYLIGHDLPNHESVWHGKTAVTAGADGDMEFWIPKAANLFHFAGGARFVHGGAMLQEIVVPVVTVRHKKDKGVRGETKVRPVTVQVLGTKHKITTNRHRFELIQMEAVTDRIKGVTLKVAVYEGDEPVTNIEAVTFNSTSDKLDERRKWVQLVLQEREYSKSTTYRLVLRNAETGIEQQSETVVIDRAFTDDF